MLRPIDQCSPRHPECFGWIKKWGGPRQFNLCGSYRFSPTSAPREGETRRFRRFFCKLLISIGAEYGSVDQLDLLLHAVTHELRDGPHSYAKILNDVNMLELQIYRRHHALTKMLFRSVSCSFVPLKCQQLIHSFRFHKCTCLASCLYLVKNFLV
jgi:hypothetical protein